MDGGPVPAAFTGLAVVVAEVEAETVGIALQAGVLEGLLQVLGVSLE